MSSIKLGSVWTHKEGSSGYYMAMEVDKKEVTFSPIFGYKKLIYGCVPRSCFERLYSLHNGQVGNSTVQARYDHEVMKRWKIICG